MTTPTTHRAGDSLAWTNSLPEYPPAAGWSLHYRILFTLGTAIDIEATPTDTDYTVSLSATATATWPAGTATLVAYVENGSGDALQRITLDQSALTVLPNLITAATHDARTANERALAAAETALADYVASGKLHVQGYNIAGRQMQFRSAADIRELITHYRSEVNRERAAIAILSGGSPGRVVTRM